MVNQLKHTFKQTAIYSLGNISTKLIGIILLPIYTNPKYLSIQEYGIWATLDVTSQILIGVLALNLPLAMMRWSAAEKKREKIGTIIFTTIIALLIIASLSLFFLIPQARFFSRLIFDNPNYELYFRFLFFTSAIGIYNGAPLNIIRLNEKSGLYVIVTTLKFAVILTVNIYFVVFAKSGVMGIIKGQLFGEIFLAIVTFRQVLKNITLKIDFRSLQGMLKYGSPLVFSSVSSFILSFGDRYILLHFLNEAKVGIYSLGYKIAGVMNMLVLQSFQLGFLPIAYKKLHEKDSDIFFRKTLNFYAVALTYFALGLSLFRNEILMIFAKNKNFLEAGFVIPLISLAFVLKGIQYNFALSFHYAKKTIYNAVIVVIAASASLLFNFILIPLFGIIGASIAMLFSIGLMLLLSYFLGRKVYKINYDILSLTKIVLTASVIYFFSNLFSDADLLTQIIIKIILFLLFPLFLYSVGIFTKSEKLKIKEFISKNIFGEKG